MARATTTVTLTLDAKSEERAAWQLLAEKERRLTRDREKVASAKRGALTRQINETREGMDALAAEIAAGQIVVTVQALPRGKYRELLRNNPPRPDDWLDKRIGYNGDTMPGQILRAATIAAKDHAGEDVPLELDDWIDEDGPLNDAEFTQWLNAALSLNTRPVDQSPPLRVS